MGVPGLTVHRAVGSKKLVPKVGTGKVTIPSEAMHGAQKRPTHTHIMHLYHTYLTMRKKEGTEGRAAKN